MSSNLGETGTRHAWPDRAFHWVSAATVIVLAATAFLPILGVRFAWLTVHWVAGLVLVAAVLFHVLRVLLCGRFHLMRPDLADLREMVSALFARRPSLPAAKYGAFQKGLHWTFALTILLVLASGLAMLLKIDTPFWNRDPAILSDAQWGLVYVLHGLAALAILFLVIMHIYFTILPEHRALLRSMIAGKGPLVARGTRDE